MGKIYELIDDFNNVSVRIRLNKKLFNAIIKVIDNNVYLSVDVSKDNTMWRIFDNNCNEINGKTLYNNVPISFINCYLSEKYTNRSIDDKTILYLEFRVGFIIIGAKMRKISSRIFDKAEVYFDNIDLLTNTYPYKFDAQEKIFKSNPVSYKISCCNYNIEICFLFENKSRKDFILERNTFVRFDFQRRISFEKLLREVYKLNFFLMVLMRRHIVLQNVTFFNNKAKSKVFICSNDKRFDSKLENSELLNITRPKIEEIDNIDDVYMCYLKKFKKLYPVLDVYYNTIRSFTSDLNRFIVGTTTLEYFSNEFAPNAALSCAKNNSKYRKSKIDYIDKVHSLIDRVNCVYNFTQTEIEIISRNIVDARVYYVHYNKKRKELTPYEQFYYSQFVFDILILNIGVMIGIDQSLLKSLSNYGKNYKKNGLL